MAQYSIKQNFIFVIFRNIFFILIIVAIYHYAYEQYFKIKLDEAKALEAKYQVVYNDLEKFAKINEGMYETRLRIEDIISNYPAVYAPNQALNAQFIDRIMAAADEYSIKVTTESVPQGGKSNATILRLHFNTKYENIYKFIFALEMFSQIPSFSIDENGDVSVDIVPLTYSPGVDSYFSGRTEAMDELRAAGYFKEIFKNSSELLNSMGHIPSWRDIDPAPETNPFYEYVAAKINRTKVVVRRKPPPIKISGIIFDAQNPIVIIDGKLYRQGDFYKTVKILTILERTITIELDGQKYIIKFEKEES